MNPVNRAEYEAAKNLPNCLDCIFISCILNTMAVCGYVAKFHTVKPHRPTTLIHMGIFPYMLENVLNLRDIVIEHRRDIVLTGI